MATRRGSNLKMPAAILGGKAAAQGGKTGHSPESAEAGWKARILEAALERAFVPGKETLVSFLVNALYLFGDHGIFAHGDVPEEVSGELTRLGHRIAAGDGIRYDRAVMLGRAFGRIDGGGGDGDREAVARLRAMGRSLRPGGLLCFYVFDRDRAWDLAGERPAEAEGRRAHVRLAFEPSAGSITARLARTAGPDGRAAVSGPALAVKAWNLAEIRALLRAAGLELERAYGDWDGRSPEAAGAETGRLIVVAAKPRGARRSRKIRRGEAA